MSAAEQPPESEHRPHHNRTIHGLSAPGVRLSKAEMIALAEKILVRAR
ncbi:MAG: hypothetical protein WCF33_09770 [Pseudonocardiaceae bacterium]